MESLWHEKNLPELTTMHGVKDKFHSISHYLSIDRIECKLERVEGFKIPLDFDQRFLVVDLHGPRDNHTRPLLKEYTKILREAINDYTSGDADYDDIKNTLENLKTNCEKLASENDMGNELRYKGDFKWYVNLNGENYEVPGYHLDFSPIVLEQLSIHLNLRRNFYAEILAIINHELILHATKQTFKKSPYTWNSEHAELEIAELLSVLHYTMKRIQFNKEEGGSFPKFRKIFYELFGLSDSQYSKKINQVQKRKKGEHFVTEMANTI